MFSNLYKTPTPTPSVNCNENIEQNIICYQIYDTVIGLNKMLASYWSGADLVLLCGNIYSTSCLPYVYKAVLTLYNIIE
jgi:hypothetical protein